MSDHDEQQPRRWRLAYGQRGMIVIEKGPEMPLPMDVVEDTEAALAAREDIERPPGALLPCVDGMADNYGRPFSPSSASGTSDPMPARTSEGQRLASSAAAEPSTSPCSRPGCTNTAPGHECAQTGREDTERPDGEVFVCERCGDGEIPVALAYQAEGDGRLYCSEKCMGKPGEAGDTEQEQER